MDNKLIAKSIKYLIKSEIIEDRMFVAIWLKQFGKIGQRLYSLNPTPELKKSILQVKNLIEKL